MLLQIRRAHLLGHGGQGIGAAAAADGGHHVRLAGRRQDKQHTLRRLLQHLQQGVGTGAVQLVRAFDVHGASPSGERGVEYLPPHLAHTVHADIPGNAFARQQQVFRALTRQNLSGGGAAVWVKVIRGQAARGKARACACLAAKQDTMRKPPGRKRGREAFLECFISEQGIQRSHYSFSKRSTLVTNTVAPPTVTSSG